MVKGSLSKSIIRFKNRAFAAIMAAVLLGVSVPVTVYADEPVPETGSGSSVPFLGSAPQSNGIDDNFEVNFVVIPEGFGVLGRNTMDVENIVGSKTMFTANNVKASWQLYLYLKEYANIIKPSPDANNQAFYDVLNNREEISNKFDYRENPQAGTTDCYVTVNGSKMLRTIYQSKSSEGFYDYLESYSDTIKSKGYTTIIIPLKVVSEVSGTGTSTSGGSHTDNSYNDTKIVSSDTHQIHDSTNTTVQYPYDLGRAVTSAVITIPYPNAGGTTSGDVQGYSTTGTTITAIPNSGYIFDHWEKNGVNIGGTKSMSVTAAGSLDVYAAVFKRKDEWINGVIVLPDTNVESKKNMLLGTSYFEGEETETTIRAPKEISTDGTWYFDHWDLVSYDIEHPEVEVEVESLTLYQNEVVVPVRKRNDRYTAHYTQYPRGVFVKTESKDGQVITGRASGGGLRRVNGTVQHTYTLSAEPEEGYVFDHWLLNRCDWEGNKKLSNYRVPGGQSITVNTTDYHDEYTAVFVSKENFIKGVHAAVSPETPHGIVTGGKAYEGVDTSTTIKASDFGTAWFFDHWGVRIGGDTAGREYDTSFLKDLTVPVTESADYYYAYYTMYPRGVYVDNENVEGGRASGGGPRRIGETVQNTYTLSAQSEDGYVFDHWEVKSIAWNMDSYSESKTIAGGATVTVNTTELHDVYKPVFKKKSELTRGVRVEVASGSEGRGVAIGSKAYEGNDTTTIIKAKADTENGWYFDHWGAVLGSGSTAEFVISYSEEYTVEVTDSCDVYYAYFAESAAGTFPKSASPSQGTVAGGSAYIVNGQKVYETTLYAYPKPGYVFKGWSLASGSEASGSEATGSVATDSIVYKDSPFVVDVTEERIIYIANFKLKNSITNEDVDFIGHATGIINKLDVLADRYFDDGAFSADRSTVESKAAEAMARTDYLRIAPYSSASAMINALQEELKIPLRKSANTIGDLGTNLVSSDGEIIPLKNLNVDVSITDIADEAIEDKYGSLYKATVIMAAEPLLPADFADGKRTLLWSDTGVDKKDRLIIIQQIPGMDDEILTPIADNKGRAKFSAARLGGSRLILVKVEYK